MAFERGLGNMMGASREDDRLPKNPYPVGEGAAAVLFRNVEKLLRIL